MSTDQVLDDADLDRALRDLLPPMPRSAAWEANQRDAMVSFIEARTLATHQRSAARTHVGLADPIEAGALRRPRVGVVLGMAAVNLLLVAGLFVAPRWIGHEVPPAAEPVGTEPRVSTAPAPSAVPLAALPDRYPIVDDAGEVHAFYLPEPVGQPRRTRALIARVGDDGSLTDVIDVEVTEVDSCVDSGCTVVGTVVVDGRDATVYELARYDDQRLRSLVIPAPAGSPVISLTGADPVGFIEAAGENPVQALPDRPDGELDVAVGALPEGYDVVLPPQPSVRGASSAGAWFMVGSSQVAVIAHRESELLGMGRLSPIERVDINGTQGWTYDEGAGSPVIWQASPTTWISVTGSPDQMTAIEIARSVRLVDRSTWESTYEISVTDDDTAPAELPATPVEESSVGVASAVTGERECQVVDISLLDPDAGTLSSRATDATTERSLVEPGVSRRIAIDCGFDDGVRVGMPVTLESGLVGTVSASADDTSVVMLVTDSRFFAVAEVPEAGAVGSVRGSSSGGAPEITFIEQEDADAVEMGMMVVTAGGVNSLAPAGVPIGRIRGSGSSDRAFTIDLWSPAPELERSVTVVLYVPERAQG
jgi:hypothetical protein